LISIQLEIPYPNNFSTLHITNATMFHSSKRKSKDNSTELPTNIGATDTVSGSTGSVALASRPATMVAIASSSAPSVAFPAEHLYAS
jgi:hypothetical protein